MDKGIDFPDWYALEADMLLREIWDWIDRPTQDPNFAFNDATAWRKWHEDSQPLLERAGKLIGWQPSSD